MASTARGRLAHIHAQLLDDQSSRDRLAERLSALRQSIADTETLLRSARVEETVLQAQLSAKERSIQYQAKILSPASFLPLETISHIIRFEQCEPPRGCDLHLEDYASRQASALAAVNRQWRLAALSSPRVWANVFFDFTKIALNVPEEERSRRAYHLFDQLERAKQVPLRLRIRGYNPTQADELMERVFYNIIRTAPQWRKVTIDIHGPYGKGDACVLHHFMHPTPLLTKFYLKRYKPGPADEDDLQLLSNGQKVVFLPVAPKLRKLEVETCIVDHIAMIPRPGLTEVCLSGPYATAAAYEASPDNVLALIDGAESIETLDLGVWATGQDVIFPRAAIAFPRLKSLHFRECNADVFLPFAGRLALPALETLSIGSYAATPEELVFLRTCANITSLELTYEGDPVQAGEVSRVLGLLPRLQILTLSKFLLSDGDFRGLVQPDAESGKWLCPGLVEMKIYDCSFGDGAARRFIDMVSARAEAHERGDAVAKFTSVFFFGGDFPKWMQMAVHRLIPRV